MSHERTNVFARHTRVCKSVNALLVVGNHCSSHWTDWTDGTDGTDEPSDAVWNCVVVRRKWKRDRHTPHTLHLSLVVCCDGGDGRHKSSPTVRQSLDLQYIHNLLGEWWWRIAQFVVAGRRLVEDFLSENTEPNVAG